MGMIDLCSEIKFILCLCVKVGRIVPSLNPKTTNSELSDILYFVSGITDDIYLHVANLNFLTSDFKIF